MRTSTKVGALVATVATTTALLATPALAAGPTHPVLVVGSAGGSKVAAADGTIVSGLTAESSVDSLTLPASAHNEIASGAVPGLLDAGAVTTQETADTVGSGAEVEAKAHTADASLLGGLITADAVDTTSTAATDGTKITSDGSTTLVGLKITNINLPVSIPKNYKIKIPGVALIVLNYAVTYNTGNTGVAIGAGAFVQLLGKYGNSPLGTQIFLNPTYAALTTHIPDTPVVVGGGAYGSRLSLNALNLLEVDSGPSARIGLNGGGTGGKKLTNSTAGVHIPKLLNTGVIKTTATGTVTNTSGNAKLTAKVVGLDLLDGLIKARAVNSVAQVVVKNSHVTTIAGSASFLHLVIAGQAIPVNPDPNTVINVAGLGRVVLNEIVKSSIGVTVRAIDIKVSTAHDGLPVGARVELATSSAYALS